MNASLKLYCLAIIFIGLCALLHLQRDIFSTLFNVMQNEMARMAAKAVRLSEIP